MSSPPPASPPHSLAFVGSTQRCGHPIWPTGCPGSAWPCRMLRFLPWPAGHLWRGRPALPPGRLRPQPPLPRRPTAIGAWPQSGRRVLPRGGDGCPSARGGRKCARANIDLPLPQPRPKKPRARAGRASTATKGWSPGAPRLQDGQLTEAPCGRGACCWPDAPGLRLPLLLQGPSRLCSAPRQRGPPTLRGSSAL